MPRFKLKPAEPKEGELVTFNKSTDYKSVKLKSTGKIALLHHVQADKLVAQKKAEVVSAKDLEGVKVIETPDERTKVVIDPKNQ